MISRVIVDGEDDIQESDNVFLGLSRTNLTAHANLVCPSQRSVGDSIPNSVGQVSLIDHLQDIVGSLQSKRCEPSVLHIVSWSQITQDNLIYLDHKDLILRIRDDSSLVLGNLDDGDTLELDHSIGH